jgi:hypothetical protein
VIRSDPIQIPTTHFDIMSASHVWADESIDVNNYFNIVVSDIANTLPLSKPLMHLATFSIQKSSHSCKLFNPDTCQGFRHHVRNHHRSRAVFQFNLTAFDRRPWEMELYVDVFRAPGGAGIVGNFDAALVVCIYLDRFHSHITSNSNIAHNPTQPYCFLTSKTQPNILRFCR